MKQKKRFFLGLLSLTFFLIVIAPGSSEAWHDETHAALAKAAGYRKWFNAAGADMAKVKANHIEGYNHFVNNPPGTAVTQEMVFAQTEKYNQVDKFGHLYGAIIASFRNYIKKREEGDYGEYHLAYCAHYVGDLSQPLHNMIYNTFNKKHHVTVDGIINNKVLDNLKKIRVYSIAIMTERDLATQIARIANMSLRLGSKMQDEGRPLTKEEAYIQIGHSASLFRAILRYLEN
ncbi:hypothetical protein ACFL0H_05410 [Thermodesulfobacteriota bacterium]